LAVSQQLYAGQCGGVIRETPMTLPRCYCLWFRWTGAE